MSECFTTPFDPCWIANMILIIASASALVYYIVRARRQRHEASAATDIIEAESHGRPEALVKPEVREAAHEMRRETMKFRSALKRLSDHPNPIEAFVRAIHAVNGKHDDR